MYDAVITYQNMISACKVTKKFSFNKIFVR